MTDEWALQVAQPKLCPEGHGFMHQRKHSGQTKGWAWTCRECARLDQQRLRFAREYGITVDEYDRMWSQQAGLCAICKKPEAQQRKGKLKSLAVDHSHKTGKVRSLLCASCNVAIGYLKDDPTLARKVASYLEDHDG